MNLVFVNHMHPATPHVSGMRSWYFAREMAKLGHRVVQISQWREGTEPAPEPARVAQLLQEHDWSEPMLLAIRPQQRATCERIRSPNTPVLVRKALVAWSYLRHNGVFTDFSEAAYSYLDVLVRQHRPHATWGLFGNTESWTIAQRLARLAGCPWVADMKDPWGVFLPRPLQGPMARRFHDMAACTANAQRNAQVLERWFAPTPVLVYSGVDPCFLGTEAMPKDEECFRLTLTGSVHDASTLHRFVQGIKDWLSLRAQAKPTGTALTEIIYAGASAELVAPILQPLATMARLTIRDYLRLPDLAALCRSATANAYVWNPDTFHHKLLELLSCGRPVIAYPGETDESRRLASRMGGELHCPTDNASLINILNSLYEAKPSPTSPPSPLNDFSWQALAKQLESTFLRVISHPIP